VVCDALLRDMMSPDTLQIAEFRDKIYDILVYHLDAVECVWYILSHFVETQRLKGDGLYAVLAKTHVFLKQYNNNYRPIYHLENMLIFMMNHVHGFPTPLPPSIQLAL